MGRRLGELTKENTKCMVEVNGVRLIDRLLGQLSGLSLRRVIIVVGYQGQNLMDYIGHRYDGRLTIEYAENPIYDKTNNIYSLSLVKEKMLEDDTLLLESDLIFRFTLFQMILEDEYPNVALVAKYESWMDGTMVRIDEARNIVNFVPKKAFRYEDVDEYYKTVNIYKFSRDFCEQKYVPFLEAYCHALGNNEYYEQVLRVITLLDSAELKALPVGDEKWYEIDDIQLIAVTQLTSTSEQRMKDELRSSFDTLLTEYPSGMYVNSLLAGKYFGVRQDYMVVGNGAAELIKSLMEQCQGKMGVVYPTFEEYPNRLEKDAIVSYIPDGEDLQYDEQDLMTFFADKDIQHLLLINPDNPSGNFIPMEGLLRLLKWAKERGIQLIVDESFVDFSDDFEHNTLLRNDILEDNPHLAVMKSISKSYGVPGLRLGVLASADVELIRRIRKDISIWNINSFAEFYMQIFGKYEKEYKQACHQFIAERRRFEALLKEIPYIRLIPTQANFFCLEVIDKYSSAELTKLLLERYNIMVKDCNSKTSLKGRNYIRISVRDEQDNDALIAALRELRCAK